MKSTASFPASFLRAISPGSWSVNLLSHAIQIPSQWTQ
jgi:hypothetical protein